MLFVTLMCVVMCSFLGIICVWGDWLPEPNRDLPYGTSICGQTRNPPTIDGKLNDWRFAIFIAFDSKKELLRGQNAWNGVDDLSVTWSTMWDEDNFYFAAAVRDDKFAPGAAGAPWEGDCIFLYIDGKDADVEVDNKINFALIGGKARVSDWSNKNPGVVDSQLAIVPNAQLGPAGYIYEAAIPLKFMTNMEPKEGNSCGFTPGYEEGTNNPENAAEMVFMDWDGVDPDQAVSLGKLTFGGPLAIDAHTKLTTTWGYLKRITNYELRITN